MKQFGNSVRGHYSKIQNAGDCVARTGVREIGFKFGSLPHDPGGITCMGFGVGGFIPHPKVQRLAMFKASGSLNSTSTDTLEVLTNTTPIDLHLKMRQAKEMVRLAAKHEDDPLREDFDRWMEGDKPVGRKTSILHLLFTRF